MDFMKTINLALVAFALLAIAAGPQAKAAETPATDASGVFSIDQVPISNAPLGKFPFFGLPPGYVSQNTPKPPQFGHFLFWTGKAFKDVEGQTYMVTIVGDPARRSFRPTSSTKTCWPCFSRLAR